MLWGTRGSIPRSGADFVQYGGATSCVELTGAHADAAVILFDAGTGIIQAGDEALARGHREFHILLSHLHFDHVMGLPFFQPLWRSDCQVNLYAGNLTDQSLIQAIDQMMAPPFFPVNRDYFKCELRCHDFDPGQALLIAGREIRSLALTHPQGATGYRALSSDGDLCYITDIEPDQPMQERLEAFCEGAGVLVYDCMFGDDDFMPDHGHSTWQKCLEIAHNANVQTPVVFHHHPRADDSSLNALARSVSAANTRAVMAFDGAQISLQTHKVSRVLLDSADCPGWAQ